MAVMLMVLRDIIDTVPSGTTNVDKAGKNNGLQPSSKIDPTQSLPTWEALASDRVPSSAAPFSQVAVWRRVAPVCTSESIYKLHICCQDQAG